MMRAGYELFDHTADMGIRVCATSYTGLLAPAAAGLYAAIGDLAAGGEAKQAALDLTGRNRSMLLRDYLAELLMWFERDRRIVTSCHVENFQETRLSLTAQIELVDPQQSEYHREVKAITYHALDIRPVDGGYEATVIVDI